MKKLTIVIRYEENEEQPSFHTNMKCLGGVVEGVMFADALEALEEAEDHISAMSESHAN